jgi:hypothetical protein
MNENEGLRLCSCSAGSTTRVVVRDPWDDQSSCRGLVPLLISFGENAEQVKYSTVYCQKRP